MKPLQALLAVFACAALPALGQLVEDPETGLRTGTITVNGQTYTIEPNANLSGANLSGADLSRADLFRTNLFRTNLSEANLSEANLSEANLSGAGLDDANLSWAYLSEANLTAANLSRANFNGADLTGASLGGIIRAILDVSNLVEIWSMETQITEQATSIESNSAEISDLKTMVEAMSVQLGQLNTQIGDLQAAVARRDATIENLQGDLATAIAERDARFTEDQIRAMSADYTIGLNAAGNVQMKINFFESKDLNAFAPFTVNSESVSVVDGRICLEFAPADNAAFFHFRVQ